MPEKISGEKFYHIYACEKCIFHSLREEEFNTTWTALNRLADLLTENAMLSYEEVFEEESTQIEHYWSNDEIFGENFFTFHGYYEEMVRKFPSGSTFVEVGCWKGRSSSCLAVEIANSGKNIRLFCVDPWEGSIEHKGMKDLERLYDVFIENMKPVEKYYFPLKLPSVDAAKRFKDKSIEFVFLDGSHEYEDVREDILAWLPKIKPGGTLAGHDYHVSGEYWPGVKQAVEEIFPNNFIYHMDYWIYNVPDVE